MTFLTDDPSTALSLSDYDYALPRHLVAKYPLAARETSRMMVLDRPTNQIKHHQFNQLPMFLKPGDLVVMNNTRVLPARFLGHRQGHTGTVEVLLLHPTEKPDEWSALMRPARKLKPGTVIELPQQASTLEVMAQQGRGEGTIKVHLSGLDSVEALMTTAGTMPIPPYLERPAEPCDQETYQTVYAKIPGSQAAPTAGLHFTPEVITALHQQGIQTAEITLNVGLGTFRNVETDDITQHVMHGEYYQLSTEAASAIEAARQNGGRIIAIGTTTAKTLETVAHKYHGRICADSGWSQLFIYPGFQWHVVNGLLTNFHLPKTTLLMMISAFARRDFVMQAYHTAVAENYRFYSYGDCMLIL